VDTFATYGAEELEDVVALNEQDFDNMGITGGKG